MTVSTTTSREQYATDGATTAFTIHFPFFDDTDVNAIFVDGAGNATTLALATDFTVTGGSGTGGTLATIATLAGGGTLTLFRAIPFTQDDDYVEDDPLPADTLEGGFDRAAMRDQQLLDATSRALTFPETINPNVSGVVPAPVAGNFLKFSDDGLSIESAGLPSGTAVYASTADTNLGTSSAEAVTPAGLAGSKFNATGKHLVPIGAAALTPDTSTSGGGPVAAVNLAATNKVPYRSLDFDQSTQENAGIALTGPKSADETVALTAQFRWTAAAGSATQGVVWGIAVTGMGDGDAIDTAYSAAVKVTDSLIATGDLHVSAATAAVTVKNWAEGDTLNILVTRFAADAGDTLAADAKLIGVDLFLTTNTGNDA